MLSHRPVVALVGRPNVGKSSLLNRIVGYPHAIVEPTPGVTRDRNYATATWNGREFAVIDTGGLDPDNITPVQQAIHEQVDCALDEAEVVVLLTDVRDGLNPLDREIVGLLRKRFKGPVFIASNKVDNPELEAAAAEFYALGADEVFGVSALHGHGVADLLDAVVKGFPPLDPEAHADPEDAAPRIVLAGKPNVGKSSLFNRILGQRRMIVDNVPGTTRDSIEVLIERNGKQYRFLDTAGLRRPARRKDNVERFSVARTMASIRRTDIAVLLLDATELTITEQDKRIAAAILEAHSACIIAWNKWDAVDKSPRTWTELLETTQREFNLLEYAPRLNCSALTGQRCDRLFEMLDQVIEEGTRRIPGERLRQLLFEATTMQPPPSYRGRVVRLKSLIQLPGPGVLFKLVTNEPEGVHFSYQRYIINQLRREAGFTGWPIKLVVAKAKSAN